MKELQRFLSLIDQFITLGERFATGMSTIGVEITYTYNPDTRIFEAEENGVLLVHYDDNTKALLNLMPVDSMLCAIEAMEEILSDLTNGKFECLAILAAHAALPEHVLFNPRRPTVSTVQKEILAKSKEIVKAFPCGVHMMFDGVHIHYNGRTRLLTIMRGPSMYARYNALSGMMSYYFPDGYYQKIEAVMNKTLALAKS